MDYHVILKKIRFAILQVRFAELDKVSFLVFECIWKHLNVLEFPEKNIQWKQNFTANERHTNFTFKMKNSNKRIKKKRITKEDR